MRSCPAVLARGGSSRGLLILESDLAGLSEQERLAAFAFAVGSPDPDARQVNGVGGGNATTSKVATVAPSTDGQHDVDYRFYQIIVASGAAETRGTCGNLVAAVGQFAVEYGFVEKSEPITRVVVRDINTDATMHVEVPVSEGHVVIHGSTVIAGVPGSGAPVPVRFAEPAGRVTGTLFPTGRTEDTLTIDGRTVTVSYIDSVNPVALVHASSLPEDTPWTLPELEARVDLLAFLENVRARAAVVFGLCDAVETAHLQSPFLPFVGFFADPAMGAAPVGRNAEKGVVDIRLLSGGQPHRAVPLSAGLATATLARIRRDAENTGDSDPMVVLSHASGTINIEVDLAPSTPQEQYPIRSVAVIQTARPIMSGTVYLQTQ